MDFCGFLWISEEEEDGKSFLWVSVRRERESERRERESESGMVRRERESVSRKRKMCFLIFFKKI